MGLPDALSHTGAAGQVAYTTARGGLISFTRSLALEVGKDGITVNCVVLGFGAPRPGMQLPDDVRERMNAQTPLGRGAEPAEFAAGIAFFCSEDASYITGEDLFITGGRRWSGLDAAVLARCLEAVRGDDIEGAFRRYEAHRKPRTSIVQAISSANTWMKEGSSDTSWLYGYDAWNAPLDEPAAHAAAA